jgi:hypothetical protein
MGSGFLKPFPPALTLFFAFFLPQFTGAVLLLVFPSPPLLRFTAARIAAVTLQGVSWMIPAAASLKQASAPSWPVRRLMETFLIFSGFCRIFRRAHGRCYLPKAQPRGGLLSSPGQSFMSIFDQPYSFAANLPKLKVASDGSIARNHWRRRTAAPWPHLVRHNGPVPRRH